MEKGVPIPELSGIFWRIAYSILFYAAVPFLLLYFLWRSWRSPAYRSHWSERVTSRWDPPPGPLIWIHAVSLGEVISSTPVIHGLRERIPSHRILITTTTPTGRAEAIKRFADMGQVRYLPLDTPLLMMRFVRRVDARILLIVETELWPNLLYACREHGTQTVLINARLSERSFAAYQRVASLTRQTLSQLTAVATRGPLDTERFLSLGMPVQRLRTLGNIKFDQRLPGRSSTVSRKTMLGDRPVWLAASTHEGEEEQILHVHQQLMADFPDLLLILVPRHPERFQEVIQFCTTRSLKITLRSENRSPEHGIHVWIGNTMGEMQYWYGLADLAFVGGSLVPVGGHNPLEPGAFGLPVVSGPYVFNFQELYEEMKRRDLVWMVQDASALVEQMVFLLTHSAVRRENGNALRSFIESQSGTTHRLLSWVEELLQTPGGRKKV